MVAGASVFILVGAVFGANALSTTHPVSPPAVTRATPTGAPPAATPEPADTGEPAVGNDPTEAQEPAEGAEPAEGTDPADATDPAVTNGADGTGQDQDPGDSYGNGSETDSD
jgi:hypothetical protein